MKHQKFYAGFVFFIFPLLLCSLVSVDLFAQGNSKVSAQLEEAIQFYNDLEFEKGLSLTRELLKEEGINDQDSIAIYSVMSMLTYAMGTDYLRQSFQYLDKIAQIGPCKVPLPNQFWPQQLRDQWYDLAHARNALMCTGESDPEIKTVAIMEFDNYSVGKYQEELGFITKGLADFFEADFSNISSLKVVERDKIDFILKEIELSEAGKVDASTAVRVGKLLGAQLMIFGSIVQLDKNNTKMLCKVVKVETSEILTSVEREGKPEYFKMEKDMVMELAEKLNLALSDDTQEIIKTSGTESTDAATLYAKGLFHMDKYDYKKAYEYFKMAYDMDNTFVEAKQKMDIYQPLAA